MQKPPEIWLLPLNIESLYHAPRNSSLCRHPPSGNPEEDIQVKQIEVTDPKKFYSMRSNTIKQHNSLLPSLIPGHYFILQVHMGHGTM